MSATRSVSAPYSRIQQKTARAHAWLISRLPEPGETWTANDLDDELIRDNFIDNVHRFADTHVIKRVGVEEGGNYRVWETHSGSYELASRVDEDRELLPCGCRFAFVRVDGHIRCKTCEEQYRVEAIREFLE